MTTEFNELLSVSHGDKAQVWIVGTREQVTHLINESDRQRPLRYLRSSTTSGSRRLFRHRLPAVST